MPPRGFTNPAPITESAREARKSFFCELCQKGYSRMNEFEAHESSYDHQHKKRLKDMKLMQKDPNASDKARKAEQRANEKSGLITMKPIKLDGSTAKKGGFKKGGFKSAFAPAGPVASATSKAVSDELIAPLGKAGMEVCDDDDDDDDDDEAVGYDYYDPRRPTGCNGDCGFKGS